MGLIKIHKFIFNGFSFSDFASTLLTLSQNMRLISAVVVRRNMLAPSLCLTTGLSDREMLSCYRRYTKATHKPIHLVHAIYTNSSAGGCLNIDEVEWQKHTDHKHCVSVLTRKC